MKPALTPRQEQIVAFIIKELELRGYPPSIREIGKAVKLNSTAAVQAQLRALEQKGVIRRDGAKRRAIELVRDGRNGNGATIAIPLRAASETAGAAGVEPRAAFIRLEGEAVYRVVDNTAADADLRGGDYVVVARGSAYQPGDLLLIANGGSPYCARCRDVRNGAVTFAGPLDAPGAVAADIADILGRVTAVIRKFD